MPSLHEHHRLEARAGQRPMRVDRFLATNLALLSRSRLQRAARAGAIHANGVPVKLSYRVRPGDTLSVLLPWPPSPPPAPERLTLRVLFEDDDLLVVDKPAGLVVHPAIGHSRGTLYNGLLYRFAQSQRGAATRDQLAPHLVHRLDRETSGALLVAKHAAAKAALAAQLEARSMERSYLALVRGRLERDEGSVAIAVDDRRRDRSPARLALPGAAGRSAVTHYRVLWRFAHLTLVRCRLESGRKHQIRLHLAHLGHPLFAERRYGGGEGTVLPSELGAVYSRVMPRLALHAATLGFTQPATGARVRVRSPLPRDFRRLLALLGSDVLD